MNIRWLILFLSKIMSAAPTTSDLKIYPSYLDEKCFVVAEHKYATVKNVPKENKCPGFVCWESQLTLENKVKITWIYNNFRQKMMNSFKIKSMMKMVWHWSLEKEVIGVISTCPNELFVSNTYAKYIDGLDSTLMCEYVGSSFPLQRATQEEFLKQFDNFLLNNSMQDFDHKNQFRRSSAIYFGCALTITQTDSKAYFLCSFCSKEKSLSLQFDHCRSYATEPKSAFFPYLCSAKFVDFYACEPENVCDGLLSKSFQSSIPGIVKQTYVINAENNKIWLIMNETKYQIESGVKKISSNMTLYKNREANSWFFDYASTSIDSQYNEEILKMLNRSFPNLYDKHISMKSHIRRPRAAPMPDSIKTAAVVEYKFYHPKCCLHLLILYLLLFIVIGVMIYVTYNHYKKQPGII